MATSTKGPSEGIPILGPGVARRRVLRMLERLSPSSVFILAPAGYGKTYLAAQVAAQRQGSSSVWIDCRNQALSGDNLLARVAKGLSSVAHERGIAHLIEEHGPQQGAGATDVAVPLRPALSALSPTGICIVLDALRLDDALSAVATLSHEVTRVAGAQLVVTARDIPEEGYASLVGFHFIEPDELRLDSGEIRKAVLLLGGQNPQAETVSAILEASSGQAALACVLAKHLVSRGGAGVWHVPATADLTTLLLGLAEHQLAPHEKELLYIVGVLGSASIADIRALGREIEADGLIRIAAKIPLVRIDEGHLGLGATAHMHAVAQEVFTSRRFSSPLNIDEEDLFGRALSVLEHRGDFDRALSRLACKPNGEQDLADWLERHGGQAVAQGSRLAVREAIASLPTPALLSHPRLLVVGARLEADLSLSDEALVKAAAARDIACSNGDTELEAEATLVMARALIDQCRLDEALDCLERASSLPQSGPFSDGRAAGLSYLMAHAGLRLDNERVAAADAEFAVIAAAGKLSIEAEATMLARRAGVFMMFGDAKRSLAAYAELLELQSIPVDLRGTAMSNRATLLMEVGKLDHAAEVAREGLEFATSYGLESHQNACACAQAAVEYTAHATSSNLEVIEQSLRWFIGSHDRASEDFTRIYLATMHRAAKHVTTSMVHVDETLEHSAAREIEYFRSLAEVELAADYLSLGDYLAAGRLATAVRERCAPRRAMYHLMRADMVLAEIARREGLETEALARLLEHEEYILSENPNWSIAMYIRAFPHLLGLFAAALGPERLPTHMLRMITGHHVDEALSAARKTLEEAEWQTLAFRMLGEEGADRIAALSTTAPCRVRLFGGLDVSVGTRQVLERDWRKRKARLLFAMLVLQQGREVPREQIYDHLWPEMDADRSRNNFYVIWSSMKGALVPDSAKGEACPYVEHTGGVCKVVPEHVYSDVAEFDVLVSAARQDVHAKDTSSAIRNYERLIDLYRGDLLPGDVYDDWFSSARDRYRQEFCDAMLTAHRLLTEVGDHPGALRMVRRGIVTDPWREDLYQAALRSHISSGQRSAAIDTYLSCRAHLADQLGLDPSTETMHLYEQVLAMEERSDGSSIAG
jgi:DNA-binding SARP family transcriptional activator